MAKGLSLAPQLNNLDIGKQSAENIAKAETEKGQQIQRPHGGKDLPGS